MTQNGNPEEVPSQNDDDVMDESTMRSIILCGKIQAECRQQMDAVAKEIQNCAPTIFPSEDDKVEVMAYFFDHLRLELGRLNPDEPATVLTPPIFVALAESLKRRKIKGHVANYVKTWYEKERAKASPLEYNQWRDKFHESYLSPGTIRPRSNLHHGKFIETETTTGQSLVHFLALGNSIGYIGYLSLYNLWLCWTGERSAVRAWKNVIDASLSFVAGTFTGLGVMALAASLLGGPLGIFTSIFLGAIGAGVGGLTGNALSDYLTTKMFDIPTEEDLEKAYNLIGLTKSAKDTEINSAYRQISRENHPDKLATRETPPSEEDIKKAVEKFIKVQKAVALIKTRRNVEKANEGIDQSRPWKERFQQFFKNLFTLRRESENKTNKEMKAIAFTEGFPPMEIFEDRVDVDVPLCVVQNHVRDTYYRFFNSNVQNDGYNPSHALHGFMF